MLDDFVLRPVAYDHPDAEALTRLAQSFYTELYGAPDQSPVELGEFAPPRGNFLVGYAGSEPVAMGGWRFSPGAYADAARPAELKRMFVRTDRRRAGLARQTLQALESDAARAGADWLILETGSVQVAAVAFYRAFGYLDVPTFGYYADFPLSVSLGKQLLASHKVDPRSPGPR